MVVLMELSLWSARYGGPTGWGWGRVCVSIFNSTQCSAASEAKIMVCRPTAQYELDQVCNIKCVQNI